MLARLAGGQLDTYQGDKGGAIVTGAKLRYRSHRKPCNADGHASTAANRGPRRWKISPWLAE